MYYCPEVWQEVEWCWWELLVVAAVVEVAEMGEEEAVEAAVARSFACAFLC